MGFRIEILGQPIPKARPIFVHKDKQGNALPYVKVVNPQVEEEGNFKWAVLQALMDQGGLKKINTGPVALGLIFVMPITKNWPQYKIRDLKRDVVFYHHVKPDLDNFIKFVKDCLEGLVYHNDSQVALMDPPPRKIYGLEPKTIIELRALNESDASHG